jgi:hypothetical protein
MNPAAPKESIFRIFCWHVFTFSLLAAYIATESLYYWFQRHWKKLAAR